MNSDLIIKIEPDKSTESEYLIKDLNNIILGRFNIASINNKKKRCDIDLIYYKEYKYSILKDTLVCILRAIFKNVNIFKVNIKICEDLDISPFLDLGFILEGIIGQNEFKNGKYIDELILGITRIEYENGLQYSNIELQGNDIVVKNLTPANADDLLKYYIRNKEHLAPFEPLRDNDFYTIDSQRKILNESYKQFMNGTSIDLGIFKEEKLIGKVKVSNIVYGSFKSGIIGYSMDKEYCGKGYMKQAVTLVLKYSFEECDLHRIEASALADNEKSRNVLRRCGFKLIGINEKYLLINGKWRDHASYYIVKEDFYKQYQG